MAKRSKKKKKSKKQKPVVKKSLIQPTLVRFKPINEYEGRSSDFSIPLVMEELEEPIRDACRLAINYDYELRHRPQMDNYLLLRGTQERTFSTLQELVEHIHVELGAEICDGRYIFELPENLRDEMTRLFGEENLRELALDHLRMACTEVFGERSIGDELNIALIEEHEEIHTQALEWMNETEWGQFKLDVIAHLAQQDFIVQRGIALRTCIHHHLALPEEPIPAEVEQFRRYITHELPRESVEEGLADIYFHLLHGPTREECLTAVRYGFAEDTE